MKMFLCILFASVAFTTYAALSDRAFMIPGNDGIRQRAWLIEDRGEVLVFKDTLGMNSLILPEELSEADKEHLSWLRLSPEEKAERLGRIDAERSRIAENEKEVQAAAERARAEQWFKERQAREAAMEAEQVKLQREREDQEERQRNAEEGARQFLADAAHRLQRAGYDPNFAYKSHLIRGRIQQITPDGLLLQDAVYRMKRKRVAPEYEPIFVVGAHGTFDGDWWTGVLWPAGAYAYITVTGSGKTIQCFATDPVDAMKRKAPR